jgi:hypothetical protein
MDATSAVIETCETMETYTALMERETESARAMRLEEVTRLGDTKSALGKKLDHQIMVLRPTGRGAAPAADATVGAPRRGGRSQHGGPEERRSRHPAGHRHRGRCDETEAAAACHLRLRPAECPLSDRQGASIVVRGDQYHVVSFAAAAEAATRPQSGWIGAKGGAFQAFRPFAFSTGYHMPGAGQNLPSGRSGGAWCQPILQ